MDFPTKVMVCVAAVLALGGCATTQSNQALKKRTDAWVLQKNWGGVVSAQKKGWRTIDATPIFGKLVTFSMPKGFRPVYENTQGGQYIQESVPVGESTSSWTQMITLTGGRDVATVPKATPRRLVMYMAAGYKRSCPHSFLGVGLGRMTMNKHKAFGAILGCGTSGPEKAPRSEMALVVAFSGGKNLYTVQWAQRGAATKKPPKVDSAKWEHRLHALMPIRICTLKPGDKPPYPDCIK